jgi:hypothetical protein
LTSAYKSPYRRRIYWAETVSSDSAFGAVASLELGDVLESGAIEH